jgi:hypothetical protein
MAAVTWRQLPQLARASGVVGCEGIERENDRWRHPLVGGEGGSKSVAPNGRLRWRGEHTTTPRHGGGGGVVLFGWCRASEGGWGKRGVRRLRCESREENREGKQGQRGRTTQRRRGEGVWQRDMAVRGGGGPAPAATRARRRRAGEREAGVVGRPTGWGPAGGGKGGYDRWAQAGERK